MADPKPGCPVCGKAVDPRLRPFCSRRCADVDLGRWFGEHYAVPARPQDDEGDDDLAP